MTKSIEQKIDSVYRNILAEGREPTVEEITGQMMAEMLSPEDERVVARAGLEALVEMLEQHELLELQRIIEESDHAAFRELIRRKLPASPLPQ